MSCTACWLPKRIVVPLDAWRFALQVYLPLRVGLSAIMAIVRALYMGDLAPDALYRPYLGLAPIEGGWRGLLLGVWLRWDTCWYVLIAREGYSLDDTRIFAPPLYPWLMRLAGRLLGGSETAFLLGGLIVSNLACVALFAYLFALVRREWGEALARRSVAYLALFPTAFFLLAAYSESLLLLCVVAAFYHARKGQNRPVQWVIACLWAFLAPLARLPGAAIILPLALEFVLQRRDSRVGAGVIPPSGVIPPPGVIPPSVVVPPSRASRPLAWWEGWPLILALLGVLAYPLYVRFALGSESLWAPYMVHRLRFAGRFAMPWQSIAQAVRVLASGQFRPIEPLDLFLALLFVGLTAAACYRLPATYAVYMVVMLLGALVKVGQVQPLLSLSRYVLALFPGFVLLARLGERSAGWNRAIVYPSMALSMFCAGQFALWGWVG